MNKLAFPVICRLNKIASRAHLTPSRRQLVSGVLILSTALFVFQIVLRPIPGWALPWIMGKSSALVLPNPALPESGPTAAVRKAVGLWLEQSLASHAFNASNIPPNVDDAERIAIRLKALKPFFVTQNELWHHVVGAPVGLAGLSWCDGMNGFAAKVFAHEFPKAQIVGVRDPITGAGHSFGRVWSAQYGDWLYFDLWPAEISVFRSSRDRPLHYLFQWRPPVGEASAEDTQVLRRLHGRAHRGLMHNELQPTLFGYIAARVSNLLVHGDSAPAGAAEAIENNARSVVAGPMPPAPPNTTKAAEAYLRARAHHSLGQTALARDAYVQFLKAEGANVSPFGHAARTFIGRLSNKSDEHRNRFAS